MTTESSEKQAKQLQKSIRTLKVFAAIFLLVILVLNGYHLYKLNALSSLFNTLSESYSQEVIKFENKTPINTIPETLHVNFYSDELLRDFNKEHNYDYHSYLPTLPKEEQMERYRTLEFSEVVQYKKANEVFTFQTTRLGDKSLFKSDTQPFIALQQKDQGVAIIGSGIYGFEIKDTLDVDEIGTIVSSIDMSEHLRIKHLQIYDFMYHPKSKNYILYEELSHNFYTFPSNDELVLTNRLTLSEGLRRQRTVMRYFKESEVIVIAIETLKYDLFDVETSGKFNKLASFPSINYPYEITDFVSIASNLMLFLAKDGMLALFRYYQETGEVEQRFEHKIRRQQIEHIHEDFFKISSSTGLSGAIVMSSFKANGFYILYYANTRALDHLYITTTRVMTADSPDWKIVDCLMLDLSTKFPFFILAEIGQNYMSWHSLISSGFGDLTEYGVHSKDDKQEKTELYSFSGNGDSIIMVANSGIITKINIAI